MFEINTEKPERLDADFINRSFFECLRKLYETSGTGAPYRFVHWHPTDSDKTERDIDENNPLRVLGKVSRRLLDYSLEVNNEAPIAIAYDIRAGDVQPGSTQSHSGGLHVDGQGHELGTLLVSDALPTLFIVDTPDNKQIKQEFLESQTRAPWYHAPGEINRALAAGVFTTYVPEPGEAVIMRRHIHSARINTTNQIIPRVFLRATMTPRR